VEKKEVDDRRFRAKSHTLLPGSVGMVSGIKSVRDNLNDSGTVDDYLVRVNVEIGNEKKVLEVSISENFMEAINKFSEENELTEESKKIIIKNVMKHLYQRRIEKKYLRKKIRLNSRQVNELIREFRSWEEEVEAKVKVILHKYNAPVINERSKQIVELKRLAKQSVYKRLYNSTEISKGLYFRYNIMKTSTKPIRRQNTSPTLYKLLFQDKKQTSHYSLPKKTLTMFTVHLILNA
jgi:hypothetical protein